MRIITYTVVQTRMWDIEPAQRIPMINRCAATLQGQGWAEIDFILQQFNVPTSDQWSGGGSDGEFNYVRSMLSEGGASDENMIALHDYLHGPATHDPEEEPWQRSSCRVFLTHLWDHRDDAITLQEALDAWGVDSFVAHRDIDPGAEWVRVISAALQSCDGLVALLHDGFKESDWCDQEVGVALGRKVPVIPVNVDSNPYGLLGSLQALTWPKTGDNAPRDLARHLVDLLLDDKRTHDRAVEAIVQRLEDARSYEEANRTAAKLLEIDTELSDDQITRLRAARENNRQVGEAWHARSALDKLIPESVSARETYGPDDAPF